MDIKQIMFYNVLAGMSGFIEESRMMYLKPASVDIKKVIKKTRGGYSFYLNNCKGKDKPEFIIELTEAQNEAGESGYLVRTTILHKTTEADDEVTSYKVNRSK